MDFNPPLPSHALAVRPFPNPRRSHVSQIVHRLHHTSGRVKDSEQIAACSHSTIQRYRPDAERSHPASTCALPGIEMIHQQPRISIDSRGLRRTSPRPRQTRIRSLHTALSDRRISVLIHHACSHISKLASTFWGNSASIPGGRQMFGRGLL